ncbi:zinc finger protein 646 isoform 1-T2 [Leptodactylus fuscus]|uniref:zinc finger protein 646 n=1 Tax=Leptodactylus fuscus TaxID=238119 RepID=UPI003F4EA972
MSMEDETDQADGSVHQNLNCDQYPMAFSGLTELESHKEDRPYKCNQCDKSYRHAGSLVNHKKTHQIGLYTCLICQKEYSNPMGLKSHLRTHSEEKRFKCEQCGEAFRMSQQLYNHRRSLHGYYSTPNGEKTTRSPKFEVQSPVLVESSNLMSNLENYIAESMLPVDFPQLVSKYYPDEKTEDDSPVKEEVEEPEVFTDEKDQVNVSNVEEYRYKCNQCGKAYKHAGSLANHKQSHMVGVYQCAVCYKEFSNLMAMKNHCRLHSDSRVRRSCKSPRSSAKSVGVHIERSDPPQLKALQSTEEGENPTSFPDFSENAKCEEDNEAVSIPQTQYQENFTPSISPPAKPKIDDLNDTSFSSDSMTERANEDETKEKVNDFLGEQPEYEEAHEEDARSGDRPFRCQECGKSYRHAGSLINHKKTHQTGVYSCSLCSKQMFNMAALKNHLRAHFKSRAGRRLGEAYFPSAIMSDELYQNQEDAYQGGICEDVSTNENDFLQHQFLQQKQEVNEMSSDKQVEEALESGNWQQTPQGSSNDSAYSSGPGFPDVKIETNNLTLQQWSQDDTLAAPHEMKLENGEADVRSASASFEQPQPDQITLKEAESSGLEEHSQLTDDRPHKCEICDRTYRHKSSLINHKLTHKTGIYQCSLCPKQYSNLMALRNHVRFHSRSYVGRRGLVSRRGRQFFRTKSRFLQNKNSHSLPDSVKVNDQIPHEATTSHGALQEPINESQTHSESGMSFDCSEHLHVHIKSCRSTTPSPTKTSTNVQCDVSISTSTINDLSKVKEPVEPQEKVTGPSSNHRRRVYECDLCDKSYRHSGSLINHKRTHQTGDYMCPYCSKHVHNMAALKNHIRIHHKVKKGQQGELHVDHTLLYSDSSYPPDCKELYGCVSCEEMFHTENDLLAHQMLHIRLEENQWDHPETESSSPEVNKETTFRATCDWDCSNNLHFQDDDHKHSDSTEDIPPEFTCVECGEVYDHIDDLNIHKRSHQAGIYQCSFCPKEYPNLLALRTHFETHTKPQTLRNTSLDGSDGHEFVDSQDPADHHYDCGHCGLVFSNEVDFHQHQVAHEKQVLDESLPGLHDEQETEFSFSMHSSERELLSRIKSEIEETEPCEVSDGGSLLSHICGFCGKTYDDLESLKAHSFSHRNEEEEECSANEDIRPETVQEETPTEPNPTLKEEEVSGSTVKKETQECRPYTCEQCGKTYRHGGSLVNHKKTHLVGNFQCVACSRRYPNLAAYRTHLRHHPKCKPAALNNHNELQTSTLNNHILPSGDKTRLSFPLSGVPVNSARRAGDMVKYTTEDDFIQDPPMYQSYSQLPLNNKNSRRPFSRRSGRRSRVQTSPQITLQNSFMREALKVSEVEDKRLQACNFCGKKFGAKGLALHLTGYCGSHSGAKLGGAVVELKKEIQDFPILPNSSLLENERESGFHRRPFRCEVCGRSYRHAGSLINHKQTHKTGIFRCSVCQKRFFNLMAMKNHNRIHFELKRHKCLDCGKAFRLRKQLDTHQRIHRQKASVKKLGRRNRKSRYRRFAQGQHRKSIVHVSSEGSFVGKANDTGDKSSDSRVKREMDADSRPYQCEECGRSYRHAGSLFNHKKSHKMGQYHCLICDKTYSNLMALKNHQRTHYEAKRHPCSQCEKTFKWKRQLLRHQLVHSQEGFQPDSQMPSGTEEAKTIDNHQEENSILGHEAHSFKHEAVCNVVDRVTYKENDSASTIKPECVSCGTSFIDYTELESHSCKENGLDTSATKSEKKDERPYRCDICNRTYRHAGSLHTHKSTHKHGNYKCSVCNKEFLNPIAMKTHLRTHTARKRAQRVDCGQSFQSSQELSSNNTVHAGEKSFHCPTCNRRFSCQLTLRHHQRTHEPSPPSSLVSTKSTRTFSTNSEKKMLQSSGKLRSHKDQANPEDRKYKCKQCGRSYLHAGSLFNHQKTHNIGVYKCPNCLKVFSNLLAFKNHLRIHRYNCTECGKAFRNSSDLVAHTKIHKEGSFTCSLCNKHFLCRSSYKQHQRIHNHQDGDILDPQAVSNFMVEVT